MNLAVNALDAMKRSGTLWIETRRRSGAVEISVRDTGCGMTDAVRAHMFEPFFTTKGVGVGTGLGLSVVHGIVEEAAPPPHGPLRARGYTVHEASEGRMALALLEDHEVQLMVTDVVMPHMNGRVLADAAKVRVPRLPVLFMSDYTDDEILRSGVLHTEVPFLEKPFRLDALAQKIRAMPTRAGSTR